MDAVVVLSGGELACLLCIQMDARSSSAHLQQLYLVKREKNYV